VAIINASPSQERRKLPPHEKANLLRRARAYTPCLNFASIATDYPSLLMLTERKRDFALSFHDCATRGYVDARSIKYPNEY
jgi:hypothetical protein